MQNNVPFPAETTKQLFIQGEAGKLELGITVPEDAVDDAIAIICHPHPLHEGTMNNKVVTTLAMAYNKCGIHAVRFNFRHVEGSDGEFGQGVGEMQDLNTVWDWVVSQKPNAKIYLAGFSFGAAIAMNVGAKRAPYCLVTISPPTPTIPDLKERYRWIDPNLEINCPWLVVQGLEDEIIPHQSVQDFVASRKKQPKLILMEETSHFFHRKLIPLRNHVVDFAQDH